MGRAYLVRNYKEQAFTANDVTSWGDEVQMVVTTSAVFGEGPSCYEYVLDGQISPTGYGKGYASSDRYRLEGKPLVSGHSKVGPNPDVFLAHTRMSILTTILAPKPSEQLLPAWT